MKRFYIKFLLTITLMHHTSFGCASNMETKRLFSEYNVSSNDVSDSYRKRKKIDIEIPSLSNPTASIPDIAEQKQETCSLSQTQSAHFVFAKPDLPKFIEAKRHFNQGVKEYSLGNYQKARDAYDQALNLYQMVQTSSYFDNTLKHLIVYHRSMVLDCLCNYEDDSIRHLVIQGFQTIGDAQDAPNFLKVKSYFYLGSISNNLRCYGQEIEYYNKSLALTNDYETRANINYHRALALKELGQKNQALDELYKIYRAHQIPRLVRLNTGYQLGLLYDNSGDFTKALRYFKSAIDFIHKFNIEDEIEFDITYHYALACIDLENYSDASQSLNKIITSPKASNFVQANASYQLGLIESKQHNHKKAIEHYDFVINFFENSPSNDEIKVQTLIKRSLSNSILNKNQDALNDLMQAFNVPEISNKVRTDILLNLALCNYRLKNFMQASQQFETLLKTPGLSEKIKQQVLTYHKIVESNGYPQ